MMELEKSNFCWMVRGLVTPESSNLNITRLPCLRYIYINVLIGVEELPYTKLWNEQS